MSEHDDRALCDRLRLVRSPDAGSAAARIDALHLQRQYAVAEIATRDETIRALRSRITLLEGVLDSDRRSLERTIADIERPAWGGIRFTDPNTENRGVMYADKWPVKGKE